MKITKQELKQLIKEEVYILLNEQMYQHGPYPGSAGTYVSGAEQSPPLGLAEPEYMVVPSVSGSEIGPPQLIVSGSKGWVSLGDAGPESREMYSPESEEGFNIMSLLDPNFYTGGERFILNPAEEQPTRVRFRENKKKK